MATAREPSRNLERHLGLASATCLVIGELIGIGIFLTPASMAKSLGSPLWLLVVWLAMGVMALAGALCYGELAARFPEAGGGYVYLRQAYGPLVAFLYGWKCLLVLDPGITAALAVGLGSYVAYLLGLSALGVKAVAVAVILGVAAIHTLGVRLGAGLMRGLALVKLGALSAMAFLALALGAGEWSHFVPLVAQRPGSQALPAALAGATIAAFFSFGGWWDLTKLAGEVRDPRRTLPRALALGVGVVTLVYLLTSAVFLYLVPIEGVTSGETFAAQAGEALFGHVGGLVFSSVVIVAVLGSLAAILMTAPRVYYAMARDGVFFAPVAAVHPRFGTPARAIGVQAALACVLVALGTFQQIIAYFLFATVLFIAATVAALLVLRARHAVERADRRPGHSWPPIVFLALVAVLLVLLAASSPLQAGTGLAVVALGTPVYYLLRRRPLRRERT